MRQVNEPVVFVKWQEVGRRCERIGMSVIAALYALAIVGLTLTAFAVVSYGLLLLWAQHQSGPEHACLPSLFWKLPAFGSCHSSVNSGAHANGLRS